MHSIPVANPGAAFVERKNGILAAMERVVDSNQYILGKEVQAFEAEFAAYLGVNHCVGVASGTDALRLCLMACDVSPADEVITTAHTAVATVSAIEQTGAIPILTDIDPATRCIDPDSIPTLITERTRAVIAVHIFGQPADMDRLRRVCTGHGLKLIEDCAQAAGAAYQGRPVGGLGDSAAFSFYPTKNLQALGDAGAATTQDPHIARRIMQLRQYGWDERRHSLESGINSRMDELQAAILRVNLACLGRDNERRRSIARVYSRVLESPLVTTPANPGESLHAMHLYVIETDRRDDLRRYLATRGVETALHYPTPIHRQPAYRHLAGHQGGFPATEALYRRMLTLPLYPQMTSAQVEQVSNALFSWQRSMETQGAR